MTTLKASQSFVAETVASPQAVVMAFKAAGKKPAPVKASLRLPRQRQAIAAAR
jgi:hypothetical protein